jgi:prepilin peptidase CpaA
VREAVPYIVVLVAAVIAAVTDLWKFKVYNLLTFPLFLSGVLYHWLSAGSVGLIASLAGALFGFSVLILFYLMGGMGLGDVKLVAAIGAWLGMPVTIYVFIASSLAAGIYALVLLAVYGGLRELACNFQIMLYRLALVGRHLGAEDVVEKEVNRADRRRRIIPFASMVAVGLVALLVWRWLG